MSLHQGRESGLGRFSMARRELSEQLRIRKRTDCPHPEERAHVPERQQRSSRRHLAVPPLDILPFPVRLR